MQLVSLDQALAHVRMVDAGDDDRVREKLEQATALVLMYLKRNVVLGSPEPTEVLAMEPDDLTTIERPVVQAAILEVLGNLYRFRGDDEKGTDPSEELFLTPRLRGMLSMLRDPALA